MRFGLLYELQLPRPWDEMSEHRMIHEALAEVELADKLGFDCVWANEHHFLEEYSHSSAPEVFLAAAAARTRQIHVGHAVGTVAARLQSARPCRRTDRHPGSGVQRTRRMGHRRVVIPHRTGRV